MHRIEDYLRQNAINHPDKTAIICGDETITYGQLWRRVKSTANELSDHGLRRGEARVMRAAQTIDFIVKHFAIHLAGGISVPLESSTPDRCYMECENIVKASSIPSGTADILFTTGTTGKSKGVMISHEAIIANAENLIEAQGFSHDLTFIISGPLNHIGSLSKVYPTIMCGATIYLTDGIKDTDAFFSAFDHHCPKFATFLVPASIRILMAMDEDRLRKHADKIDFIETGAAPMAQSDMTRLRQLLPKSRLYNTYASTETGIICTHDFNSDKCIAGCLGKPMKHSSIYITKAGTVACQGKTLMTGYIGEPGLTASILRDGTLFTNDNGSIDSDGMLHLTGRVDDVINVGGFKVSPSEVEDAAMSMPGIKDCVCIAAHHPIIGQALKLIAVMSDGHIFEKKKIARFLSSKLETYKVPLIYEKAESICRTFNGKIDRKHYREQ